MEDFARHYQIRFRDPELLRLALTHRSYLSVSGKGVHGSRTSGSSSSGTRCWAS